RRQEPHGYHERNRSAGQEIHQHCSVRQAVNYSWGKTSRTDAFPLFFRWPFESAADGAEQEKAPHGRRENCTPRVPPPREARSTGEMRGLTVVAGCNNYMDNRREEVKRRRCEQRLHPAPY